MTDNQQTPTVDTLWDQAVGQVQSALTVDALQQIRVEYLGRKGAVTALLKGLKNMDPDQRRETGAAVNKMKVDLGKLIDDTTEQLGDKVSSLPAGFDVTRPGIASKTGSMHPIVQMTNDLNDAFATLGFEIFQGPEVSNELYGFDNLNFPPDHPARESMDTYWIDGTEDNKGEDRLCLRPHLTGASVRYMQDNKPPFRVAYPGKVFRNETTDASHERAFYQYEALIVDKELPFTSGRLLIDTILTTVFGRSVRTRMRAGFFPFVEPGFEIDMECLVCEGNGCNVCKQVGWLEVMPGGAPHPEVLRSGGIDPEQWEGFYINIGLDRLVMMRYGISDVRLFHGGDLRFLSQFR